MSLDNKQDENKGIAAEIGVEFPKTVKGTINAKVSPVFKATINADIASSKGVPQEIIDHLTDYNNPHRTTAEQVGSYTKEQTQLEIDKRFFSSPYALPTVGKPNVLYFVTNDSEESTYIWDENTNNFRCVGSNYQNIEVINGGDEWQI